MLFRSHVWSDAFQAANDAELALLQAALLAHAGDESEIGDLKREAQIRILSALVSGWSFDAECSPDAVADFLREAPQIAAQLDKFAADSRGFFGDGSTSSKAGSSQSAS